MSSPQPQLFSSLLKKPVYVDFTRGQLCSDAGVLPVAELDRRLGLTAGFASCLRDAREPVKVRHSLPELVRQRVYRIACGYEDANDAETLRHGPLFKTAVGRAPRTGTDLASQPTLSRAGSGAVDAARPRCAPPSRSSRETAAGPCASSVSSATKRAVGTRSAP